LSALFSVTGPSSDGRDPGPKLVGLPRAAFWHSAAVAPCLLACFPLQIIYRAELHVIHWLACS